MDNGWIKLHRKLLEWEWFDDPSVLKIWLWLLFSVNHETKRWRGMVIKQGQRLTSIRQICVALRMGPETVIKSLDKLKRTGEIKISSEGNNGSLITIVKYSDYQSIDKNSVTDIETLIKTPKETPTKTQVKTLSETQAETKQEYKELKNNNTYIPTGVSAKKFDRQKVLQGYIDDQDWIYETSQLLRVPADEVRQLTKDFALQIKVEQDERATDERELSRHLLNYIRCERNHKNTKNGNKERSVLGRDNPELARLRAELDKAIEARAYY